MTSTPNPATIRLKGLEPRKCIDPELMGYWQQLLHRRLSWIRHCSRDGLGNELRAGPDGLPTCDGLPTEPPDFEPIEHPGSAALKALYQPDNFSWARYHVVPSKIILSITKILEARPKATHIAWKKQILDWVQTGQLITNIRSLDMIQRITNAKRTYTMDLIPLKSFVEMSRVLSATPTELQARPSCIEDMCRIIGIEVEGHNWLGDPDNQKQVMERGARSFTPMWHVHQQLVADRNFNVITRATASAIAPSVEKFLDSDANKILLGQLEAEVDNLVNLICSQALNHAGNVQMAEADTEMATAA
ncbi:hypothetical protein FBEOM_5115 [Fusarium beomiforme]|uniref:Uncharacterized protein n=1 Tax=Fusarium beomiforme TaxID=44412 RepID=A0A9P5ALL8_9HYPO|nr:hypothetical protein FBEOM_5115 [Fusarium beomiforme]